MNVDVFSFRFFIAASYRCSEVCYISANSIRNVICLLLYVLKNIPKNIPVINI